MQQIMMHECCRGVQPSGDHQEIGERLVDFLKRPGKGAILGPGRGDVEQSEHRQRIAAGKSQQHTDDRNRDQKGIERQVGRLGREVEPMPEPGRLEE